MKYQNRIHLLNKIIRHIYSKAKNRDLTLQEHYEILDYKHEIERLELRLIVGY